MAKRISDFQKEEITKSFIGGSTIEEIAKRYDFTKITICRNLKKSLGEEKFKRINKEIKLGLITKDSENKKIFSDTEFSNNLEIKKNNLLEDDFGNNPKDNMFIQSNFIEIEPLSEVFDDASQKDFSSISIKLINFPNMVYMIISNKYELETKQLKDYPDWQFLPLEDLERNTIEIFHDLKSAKGICNKDQKVIKVPNTNVFKIVAPILTSKGISRIISQDKLIAL